MEPILGGSSVLFEWVLRSTFQASLLVCLVMLVKAALGRRLPGKWHYFLWLVVVVRMMMPWAPESRLSMFNLLPVRLEAQRADSTSANIAEEAPQATVVKIVEGNLTDKPPLAAPPRNFDPPLKVPMDSRTDVSVEGSDVSVRRTSYSTLRNWMAEMLTPGNLLPLLWLAGALALGGYVCVASFLLWKTVRREPLVTDQGTLGLLEECKRAMAVRTVIGVVLTDKVRSPVLLGFLRPRLLLPARIIEALTVEELRYVFLHELAHLKRLDIAVGWVTSALLALHWFNPLIWYGFYRMRADREVACDALAMSRVSGEEPPAYGRTIINLLEQFSQTRYLPGMVAIMENKAQLKRRIIMITKFGKMSRKLSIVAVLILSLVAIVGLTDARPRKSSGGSVTDRVPTELKDNLLLYYSFQKDSGDKVTDISGVGRSGQVHGASYQRDEILGGVMSFDGQDDFISVPEVRLEEFSFSAWVKTPLTGGAANNRFVFTLDDGMHYYALQGNAGGALSIVSDGDEINEYDWQFGNNAWVHLALTHEDGSFKLYKDGELTEAGSVASNSVAGTFCIGGTPRQRGGCWQGMIDEVALFNRALSEQEVQRLYAMTGQEKGLGGQAETPVPYPATDEPRTRPLFALYPAIGDLRALENSPVERFGLEDEPILTNEDIVEYDWNTHTLTLRPGLAQRLDREYGGRMVTPFVVMADGQRCYLGAFWSGISSYLPRVPVIAVCMPDYSPENALRISGSPISGMNDPRSNPRVREALERAGVLRKTTGVLEDAVVRQDRPEGMIFHYSFDRDEGQKVTDTSGKGHHGSVQGARFEANGKIGGAMSFDGQDDFIGVPEVGLEEFSFSAWVKTPLTGGAANNRFIFTLDDGMHYYALQGNIGGALSIVSDGEEINEYDWQFGNNAWVHLTLTHEDGSFKLYKDGELTEAGALGSNSVAGTFCIGGTPRHRGAFWQGMIDEVALFNRALSETEVRQLYNASGGSGGPSLKPVIRPLPEVTGGLERFAGLWTGMAADKPGHGTSRDSLAIKLVVGEDGQLVGEAYGGFVASGYCRLENLEVADNRISFEVTHRFRDTRTPITLDLKNGKLQGEGNIGGDLCDINLERKSDDSGVSVQPLIRPEVTGGLERFAGTWGGMAIDKPGIGTSHDSLTVKLVPENGRMSGEAYGSFVKNGYCNVENLKISGDKISFEVTYRSENARTAIKLDLKDGRLRGEGDIGLSGYLCDINLEKQAASGREGGTGYRLSKTSGLGGGRGGRFSSGVKKKR